MRTAKALSRLRGSAGSFERQLLADAISTKNVMLAHLMHLCFVLRRMSWKRLRFNKLWFVPKAVSINAMHFCQVQSSINSIWKMSTLTTEITTYFFSHSQINLNKNNVEAFSAYHVEAQQNGILSGRWHAPAHCSRSSHFLLPAAAMSMRSRFVDIPPTDIGSLNLLALSNVFVIKSRLSRPATPAKYSDIILALQLRNYLVRK